MQKTLNKIKRQICELTEFIEKHLLYQILLKRARMKKAAAGPRQSPINTKAQ